MAGGRFRLSRGAGPREGRSAIIEAERWPWGSGGRTRLARARDSRLVGFFRRVQWGVFSRCIKFPCLPDLRRRRRSWHFRLSRHCFIGRGRGRGAVGPLGRGGRSGWAPAPCLVQVVLLPLRQGLELFQEVSQGILRRERPRGRLSGEGYLLRRRPDLGRQTGLAREGRKLAEKLERRCQGWRHGGRIRSGCQGLC